jgi:cell division protein FtsB
MENIRWIILTLSIVTIFLHFKIWVSEDGYQKLRSLSSQIYEQEGINQVLTDRNNALQAEINNLQSGNESIEERARSDLGFIKDDEIYYFVVE